MNKEGLTQQSLVITAPKYHKRYILPAGNDSIPDAVPNFSEMNKVKNRTTQMHPAFSGKDLRQTESYHLQQAPVDSPCTFPACTFILSSAAYSLRATF
uniref:Uncharacterized protein n=1 Tax=Aegilops tauschii subsp. strangulata TaxID=200361 RepID=A0A453S8Q7_AEGTS